MVNSVNNGPVSTLLRAQQQQALIAPGNSQKAARVVIDQVANGARPTTVQPGAKSAGSSKGNLPRGSLVDILA